MSVGRRLLGPSSSSGSVVTSFRRGISARTWDDVHPLPSVVRRLMIVGNGNVSVSKDGLHSTEPMYIHADAREGLVCSPCPHHFARWLHNYDTGKPAQGWKESTWRVMARPFFPWIRMGMNRMWGPMWSSQVVVDGMRVTHTHDRCSVRSPLLTEASASSESPAPNESLHGVPTCPCVKSFETDVRVSEVRVVGAGNIQLFLSAVDSDSLYVSVVGGGDFDIQEKAPPSTLQRPENRDGSLSVDKLEISVTGAGDVDIQSLSVKKKLKVSLLGSGDANVTVLAGCLKEIHRLGAGDVKVSVLPVP